MFECEATFQHQRKKLGQRAAVEYLADINYWTKLHLPKQHPGKDDLQPSLRWQRTLFDHNEHFIELSNMGEEDRSLIFMVLCLLTFPLAAYSVAWIFDLSTTPFLTKDWYIACFAGGAIAVGMSALVYFLWPGMFSPNFFTSLRARYRFNRTSRKVYVLRPKRYGGNAVLDWDRVQAHVNWCPPRNMTYDDLRDPVARHARQENGGGPFGMNGLVLYWPPFDKDDRERKGEDVLWVGPKQAGEGLWQYIRTFMEEGFAAVPAPNEFEWLRKGFHSPGEQLQETHMHSFIVHDKLSGRADSPSVMTSVGFLAEFLWVPLHSLAERLCTWPTFPVEWGSDSGQKRREDGIGPEEPLRWITKT